MDKNHNIGRNEPCPCSSGKKYKKCHGTISASYNTREEAYYVKLSRDIAYKGKIGQMREDFCIRYIKDKQGVIRNIEKRR